MALISKQIKGILLYTQPNKHTTPTVSPGIYAVTYDVGIGWITQDEIYIVGTRCGSEEFNQLRVDEYKYYKLTTEPLNITEQTWKLLDKKWYGDSYYVKK
jgi:hypothetical protein